MLNKKNLLFIFIILLYPTSFAGYEEGIEAIKNKNFELAFDELSEAVINGHGEAHIDLALMYERGVGVESDKEKAFELFKKASFLNVTNAFSFLGDMYYNGVGTDKNFEEAFQWYLSAADNEHGASTFFVARMYEYGIGTELDEDQAIIWYYKAVENHHLKPRMIKACEDGLRRLGIEYKHVHIHGEKHDDTKNNHTNNNK